MKQWLYAFSQSRRLRPVWNVFFKCIQPITKSSILSNHPSVYLWYARHLKPDTFWTAPDEHTELLVEGPGGCATHALAAYIRKHNPGIRLSHNCEVPATVKYCVRRGIPIIIPLRNIVDFERSVTERFPQISSRNAIRIYVNFYREIIPLREYCLTARFEEITAHPASVIEACNHRYGTSFNIGDDVLPRIRTSQDLRAEDADQSDR